VKYRNDDELVSNYFVRDKESLYTPGRLELNVRNPNVRALSRERLVPARRKRLAGTRQTAAVCSGVPPDV
jgi:hypothetical protein